METPAQTVARFYAAFGAADTEAVAALLAADVRFTAAGPQGVIPWAGAVIGRAGALAAIAAWRRAVEGLTSEREPTIADGEHVVVRGQGRYRVIATGRVVADRWVHVIQVRAGQIIAFDEYGDTAAAAAGFASE